MVTWNERALEDYLCTETEESSVWRIVHVLSQRVPKAIRADPHHCYSARQVAVPSGIIDILVQSAKHIYVCELKAQIADGNALAQVLAYCSHVETKAYSSGCPVHPVIIAPGFTDKLMWAVADRPVYLVELSLGFHFESVCTDVWHDDDGPYDDRAIKAVERASDWYVEAIDQIGDDGIAAQAPGTPADQGEPPHAIHQP